MQALAAARGRVPAWLNALQGTDPAFVVGYPGVRDPRSPAAMQRVVMDWVYNLDNRGGVLNNGWVGTSYEAAWNGLLALGVQAEAADLEIGAKAERRWGQGVTTADIIGDYTGVNPTVIRTAQDTMHRIDSDFMSYALGMGLDGQAALPLMHCHFALYRRNGLPVNAARNAVAGWTDVEWRRVKLGFPLAVGHAYFDPGAFIPSKNTNYRPGSNTGSMRRMGRRGYRRSTRRRRARPY